MMDRPGLATKHASPTSNSDSWEQDFHVITLPRHTSPGAMHIEVIPANLAAFAELMFCDLLASMLQSMLIKCRTRNVATPAVARRSVHLAKKGVNRTQAVAAAQNMLMRKLGLLRSQNEIELVEFNRYIKLRGGVDRGVGPDDPGPVHVGGANPVPR
jgi:hypothetical protein